MEILLHCGYWKDMLLDARNIFVVSDTFCKVYLKLNLLPIALVPLHNKSWKQIFFTALNKKELTMIDCNCINTITFKLPPLSYDISSLL